MQIVHITKDLPPPYDVDYKYGYFITVFEKSYKELPQTIDEINLIEIYRLKNKPKNTILFISHWDIKPEIKISKETDFYRKYSKSLVSKTNFLEVFYMNLPKIISSFSRKWEEMTQYIGNFDTKYQYFSGSFNVFNRKFFKK